MKDGDIVTCPSCFGKKKFKRHEHYNSGLSETSWCLKEVITLCPTCKGEGKMKVSLKYFPANKKSFTMTVTSCNECPYRENFNWGSECKLNRDWPLRRNDLDTLPESCPKI